MKTKFIYSLILSLGLVFAGSMVNNVSAQKTKTTVQHTAKKYTCTMHPEVVMNKPGKCPKCGMTLVEKKEVKKADMKTMKHKAVPAKVKKMPKK